MLYLLGNPIRPMMSHTRIDPRVGVYRYLRIHSYSQCSTMPAARVFDHPEMDTQPQSDRPGHECMDRNAGYVEASW
jgi:hypothetical protein